MPEQKLEIGELYNITPNQNAKFLGRIKQGNITKLAFSVNEELLLLPESDEETIIITRQRRRMMRFIRKAGWVPSTQGQRFEHSNGTKVSASVFWKKYGTYYTDEAKFTDLLKSLSAVEFRLYVEELLRPIAPGARTPTAMARMLLWQPLHVKADALYTSMYCFK